MRLKFIFVLKGLGGTHFNRLKEMKEPELGWERKPRHALNDEDINVIMLSSLKMDFNEWFYEMALDYSTLLDP